ncbi:MAG: DsrE family protein [Candidatus Omnitrophica bacterium]|nr:DsrE family protein [Candidatus Omnitrophota bacterium]MBI3010122.1 DsrE family protein [Candidatus Omnitrophota bacterium]
MKSLAVIVSQGSTNNLIQVLTLLMAAVHSEMQVRVLFRDEAVFRLKTEAIDTIDLSHAYSDVAETKQRLKKLDLLELHRLCRDIKASGDVRYYVCSSSLAICGLKREDLIQEIDEVRGLPAFLLEDIASADKVLTF